MEKGDQSRLILTTACGNDTLTAKCAVRQDGIFAPFMAPMIVKYVSDKTDATCTSYPLHDWVKATIAGVLTLDYDPGTHTLTITADNNSRATFICKPMEKAGQP
jgi:hypothetical protein